MGMPKDARMTGAKLPLPTASFDCENHVDRAMTLIQQMVEQVRTGDMCDMETYFVFPHALQYADQMVTITSVDDLIAECSMLAKAMQHRSIAKVDVSFARHSPARNGHLPVWVEFKLMDIAGNVLRQFNATYFCELQSDETIKIKLAQFQAPRAPAAEAARPDAN